MACTRTLDAWLPRTGGAMSFTRVDGHYMQLPCGQCDDCKASRASEAAIRVMAEASVYNETAFLTLTYSDDNLPGLKKTPSLSMVHLQKFHKRLRHHIGAIRYYAVGEYGDRTQRPHYHGCYFGLSHRMFQDSQLYTDSTKGKLYSSAKLDAIWGHGTCKIGGLTTASAKYTAQYILKKIYGQASAQEYENRLPPFVLQSQSLGAQWVRLWPSDVRTGLICIPNEDGSSAPQPIPRAMLRRLKLEDPETYQYISEKRSEKSRLKRVADEERSRREHAQAIITQQRINLKPRIFGEQNNGKSSSHR
ncbi:MAG: replication initiator protein [Microvirus sp.]|nr:MAG: replication initiator protein [Microvirus sp.]